VAELPMADRKDVALPEVPAAAQRALDEALGADDPRSALADVVAASPTYVAAWAHLAEHGRDPVERYAYARVGYHRGLDQLRRHGWGGTGLVRWEHPTNRGFLRCLARLRDAAREIGEADEVERIDEFLIDLDPDWDDANVA
jgi:hypothetical protein